jgi:hypothetical protein
MYSDMAKTLYARTRGRGQWGQVWSALTGRARHMLSLAEVEVACSAQARRYAGTRTVPVSQIRGSEGRSNDFDRDFNPLQGHTRERWLSVATAREEGKTLPLVELVQVGDIYFVLDGHHRISVARALGQQDVDAEVEVWRADGPLPWETQAQPAAHNLAGQERARERFHRKVREGSARLQERVLLQLSSLLIAVGLKLGMRRVSSAGVGNL